MMGFNCNHRVVIDDVCHDCGQKMILPLTEQDFLGQPPVRTCFVLEDHNHKHVEFYVNGDTVQIVSGLNNQITKTVDLTTAREHWINLVSKGYEWDGE